MQYNVDDLIDYITSELERVNLEVESYFKKLKEKEETIPEKDLELFDYIGKLSMCAYKIVQYNKDEIEELELCINNDLLKEKDEKEITDLNECLNVINQFKTKKDV